MIEYIIPVVVTISVAILCFIAFRFNRVSKGLPIINQIAIVRNKKVDEWKYAAGSPWIKEYFVKFEVENKILDVKRLDYENLYIEDKGQLYYQRKGKTLLFVNFIK